MILEQCKGVHCVDLGESFQTHIYLQNLASIQPRTSLVKFYKDAVTLRHSALASVASLAPLDRANFGGLVLGCIETKFCKKICV